MDFNLFLVPGHAPSSQQINHENQRRFVDIFDSEVYKNYYLKQNSDDNIFPAGLL